MRILFKNEKVKNQLEDESFLNKKFNQTISKKYKKFKLRIEISDNLYDAGKLTPSLRIEKLQGHTNLWSARLDSKHRIEFRAIGEQNKIVNIKVIEIKKIHAHKYKK